MREVVKSVRISKAINTQLELLAQRLHKKEADLIREAILVLIGTYNNAPTKSS